MNCDLTSTVLQHLQVKTSSKDESIYLQVISFFFGSVQILHLCEDLTKSVCIERLEMKVNSNNCTDLQETTFFFSEEKQRKKHTHTQGDSAVFYSHSSRLTFSSRCAMTFLQVIVTKNRIIYTHTHTLNNKKKGKPSSTNDEKGSLLKFYSQPNTQGRRKKKRAKENNMGFSHHFSIFKHVYILNIVVV